jgi:hypothetical protein
MGALGGAGVSAISQKNPAIGRALSAYGAGKGAIDQISQQNELMDQIPNTSSAYQMPQIGSDVISRRMSNYPTLMRGRY